MTRRIALIIGTALAALAFGVPLASADDWFADRQRSDFWNHDAQTGQKLTDASPNIGPGDLADMYSSPGDVSGEVSQLPRSAPDGPVAAGASDDEIEWAQIGAGLAIGILLGLGLLVGLRGVRHRPLPH